MIVYKYYNDNTRLLPLLQESQVYFNHPTKFNDPFEFPIALIYDGTPDDFLNWAREKDLANGNHIAENSLNTLIQKGSLDTFRNTINSPTTLMHERIETMNQFLVACFTERRDSPLMWAHYTSSHAGICLGFNLLEKGNDRFFEFREAYFEDLPFVYQEGYFPMRKVNYADQYPLPANRFMPDYITRLGEAIFIKQVDWEYEKEHRLSINLNWLKSSFASQKLFSYNPEILAEVIFGLQCNPNTIARVKALCARIYPKARLLQATKTLDRYDLSFLPA